MKKCLNILGITAVLAAIPAFVFAGSQQEESSAPQEVSITWWNNRNQWADRPLPDDPLRRFGGSRFCDVMAGEDEREGGALMFFRCKRPLAIAGSDREYPSPMKFIEEARQQDGI